jgi:hypothetical protein
VPEAQESRDQAEIRPRSGRDQAEISPRSGRAQSEIRPVPGARGGRLLTVPVCLRVVQTEPGPMPTLTMSAPLMMRSSVISLVTCAAA